MQEVKRPKKPLIYFYVAMILAYSFASSRVLIPASCFFTISSLVAFGILGVPFCLCIAKPPIAVSILQ